MAKAALDTSADMAELAVLLAALSKQLGLAGNVQSVITPYGLRVTLHDTDKTGMFSRGSAVADERFIALLKKIGPIFGQITNQMLIIGHTDSAQYRDRGPTNISNWTLSSDRAVAARSYLMMGGMPARSVLQLVGLADRAPFNVHGRRRESPHRADDSHRRPGRNRQRDVSRADGHSSAGRRRVDQRAGPRRSGGVARPIDDESRAMRTKARGSIMKVTSVGSPPEVAAVTTVSTPVPPARSAAPSAPSAAAPLESAVLGPALAAIKELPEIDQARVATLRDALEHGQIPFDASKLAALIDRYHRTGQ